MKCRKPREYYKRLTFFLTAAQLGSLIVDDREERSLWKGYGKEAGSYENDAGRRWRPRRFVLLAADGLPEEYKPS